MLKNPAPSAKKQSNEKGVMDAVGSPEGERAPFAPM
jgi:hypothetical protein